MRASDIDMLYLNGYGFPVVRGGPMLYADSVGLYNVARRMREFAANPLTDRKFWQPAKLIEKLAAEGGSFASFDAAKAPKPKAVAKKSKPKAAAKGSKKSKSRK